MSKSILFFLVANSILTFANASNKKEELIKQFNLTEGHYQTESDKKNDSSFCEDEELDINLYTDDKQISLVIGVKLVFPNLEKKLSSEKTKKNCSFEIKNEITPGQLNQSWTEKCNDHVTNKKNHFLKFNADSIEYKFQENSKMMTCKYKLIKKEASK